MPGRLASGMMSDSAAWAQTDQRQNGGSGFFAGFPTFLGFGNCFANRRDNSKTHLDGLCAHMDNVSEAWPAN